MTKPLVSAMTVVGRTRADSDRTISTHEGRSLFSKADSRSQVEAHSTFGSIK